MNSDTSIPTQVLVTILTLGGLAAGCSTMDIGGGSSVVTGSAGVEGAQGEAKQLAKCDAPIATVALVEDQGGYGHLARYGAPSSPMPLYRLMLQQTGCFRVVDRSAGLRAAQREMELAQAGMTRQEGQIKKGKVIEAQYSLTPTIVFQESDAGGGKARLLGFIPGASFLGSVAGSLKFKEAQVVTFLTDNETTEQIGAATGAAKATDIGGSGWAIPGIPLVGSLAAWSNTNEGKVVAAAMLDSVNKLVPQIRALAAKNMAPPSAAKK